ncbi:hypothetical protein SAMN05421505_105134 [Sinosporangium album]|uniref:Uncharacterized protein n=1 Tax=Sinosporangium album TaxID=504805 RepID=A0A1G7V5S2_9ACTN|nr:hypothetical protein [Sinosporangium album]SDG55235.1 hypothetical protein SAMN05421505_105134 [Sinosporangium album]
MDDDEVPPRRRGRLGRWGRRTDDQEADEWNSWLTAGDDDEPARPAAGLPQREAARDRPQAPRRLSIGRPSFVRPYAEPEPAAADEGDAGEPGEKWDALPPSARWYGTPAKPDTAKAGKGGHRGAMVFGVLGAGAGVVAATVWGVLTLTAPESLSTGAEANADAATGIGYPIPDGWRHDALPPVSGFTSAVRGGGSVLMIGPGSTRPGTADTDKSASDKSASDKSAPDKSALGTSASGKGDPDMSVPAKAVVELTELYEDLLLQGSDVELVEDRPFNVAGFTGHSRSVRAVYNDVINRPAFLRVLVLTRPGRDAVVLAVSQPDGDGVRSEIDDIMSGLWAAR